MEFSALLDATTLWRWCHNGFVSIVEGDVHHGVLKFFAGVHDCLV